MEVVEFKSIREKIINHFRRHSLLPILGSGFSRGSKSLNGIVPSGYDFKSIIMQMILSSNCIFSESEKNDLSGYPLPKLMEVYHEIIPQKEQLKLYKDLFSSVSLDENKKSFLAISWPYIYTLNIDDAIEKSSEYNKVIYANRKYNDTVFDEYKCIIKLHGDISEILTYSDSDSEIFDQNQYVNSLAKNALLLNKLRNDYVYNNILYVGCGLDDEIDILSVVLDSSLSANERYYCTITAPTTLEGIKLKKYGITKCVLFDNYDDIYSSIVDCYNESTKIPQDSIDSFSIKKTTRIKSSFEENKDYLFFGKSIINKSEIAIPFYFVPRLDLLKLTSIASSTIHFIIGPSCSGKTYLATELAINVADRQVYFFSSRFGVNDVALDNLMRKENSLIIFDSNVLTIEQIEKLLLSESELSKRNVSCVVVENKNNRDLYGRLVLLEKKGVLLKPAKSYMTMIDGRLSSAIVKQMNTKLASMALGVFSENRSISDNIIANSEKLLLKNKFSSIRPKCSNAKEAASLIALASEQKVYSSRVVDLDLINEFILQEKVASPLIECDSTWDFEISKSNNSPSKYVINADYWLYNQLDRRAESTEGESIIIDGYRYIVEKLIIRYGSPDLDFSKNNSEYKSYILFDNINQIFKSKKIEFIRKIYERLNDLLASDPNFLHQRAKCYIRSAKYEKDKTKRKEFLNKAFLLATEAYSVFCKRNENRNNERLEISISHTQYTRILALCHSARVDNYNSVDTDTNALKLLDESLFVQFDYRDICKDSMLNYDDVVGQLIRNLSKNKKIPEEYQTIAKSLLSRIIND